MTRALIVLSMVVALLALPRTAGAGEWYLLLPDLDRKTWLPKADVPVSKWRQVGEFDSASACQARRAERLREAMDVDEALEHAGLPARRRDAGARQEQASRCVSASGVRLAPRR